MAILAKVLDGTAGGDWLKPEDIEKQIVTITEAVGMETDIREHHTGKEFKKEKTGKMVEQIYYCIKIHTGKEEKDLHLTWYGLTQLAEKMPQKGTWQDQQFIIDEVQKGPKDKPTGKLMIRGLGVSNEKPAAQSSQAQPQPQEPADAAGKLIKALKTAPSGLLEKPFWDEVAKATGGNLSEGVRLVEKLKNEGLLYEHAGYWKAT